VCSVSQLSGSVPTPDSHSSRRSALPERGTPAALVEAAARVPRHHRAGFIGWTLYHQPSGSEEIWIIAQGTDLERLGVCYYESPEPWLPGTYALYAKRFNPQNLVPMRFDHRTWTLREERSRLGCGMLVDSLPALRL
jgi:hypothetical protein